MTMFKTSYPTALSIKLSECLALSEMGWHGIFETKVFLWDTLLVAIKQNVEHLGSAPLST